jgi:hypothetical protein
LTLLFNAETFETVVIVVEREAAANRVLRLARVASHTKRGIFIIIINTKKEMIALSSKALNIFTTLRRGYAGYAVFGDVEGTMQTVARDAEFLEISRNSVKKAINTYFDVQEYKTKEQKIAIGQVQLMIQTALVLELTTRPEMSGIQWPNTEKLIAEYPGFSGLPTEELDMLLTFRNTVKVALTVLPAHRNKARLLHIGGKAGGISTEYITGTGQSAEVDRRVAIYEQEGGEAAEDRSSRKRKEGATDQDEPTTSDGGHNEPEDVFRFSVKRAKMAKLEPTSAQQITAQALLPRRPVSTLKREHGITAAVAEQMVRQQFVLPFSYPVPVAVSADLQEFLQEALAEPSIEATVTAHLYPDAPRSSTPLWPSAADLYQFSNFGFNASPLPTAHAVDRACPLAEVSLDITDRYVPTVALPRGYEEKVLQFTESSLGFCSGYLPHEETQALQKTARFN